MDSENRFLTLNFGGSIVLDLFSNIKGQVFLHVEVDVVMYLRLTDLHSSSCVSDHMNFFYTHFYLC